MKKKRKKEIDEEEFYSDSWMYILLLATTTILAYSLSTYTFPLFGVRLTYSLVLLPVIFFISNYITKRYGYEKAITGISVSCISMVLFVIIMNAIFGKVTIITAFAGHFCGLVAAHFINLLVYYFIIQNTNSPYYLILANYIVAILMFYLFYTLINLNIIIYQDFWKIHYLKLFIEALISVVLAYIDQGIKKGKPME